MHETGKKLLNLMFRPGEKVCVSPNKYGYHSVPVEEILNKKEIILVPTPDSVEKRNEGRKNRNLPEMTWEESFESCETDKLTLLALNPISSYREDIYVTAHRSFLVEVDTGPLKEQLAYVKKMELPFSACVFSGNKSLHFLITLDRDLPSYKVYYHMAEWILNIMTVADPNTKNPSRSIRIPGAERSPGKRQILVEYNGATKLEDLAKWLAKFPNAKPVEAEKRKISEHPDMRLVKDWVAKRLRDGLDPKKGRNVQWYAIACEFALAGYSEDDTIYILSQYYTPDRDFKEREWKITIKSAFKNMNARR